MTCVLFRERTDISDNAFEKMEKVREQVLLLQQNILSLIGHRLTVFIQGCLIARQLLLAHLLRVKLLVGVDSLASTGDGHRWRRLKELLRFPIKHLRSEIPAGLNIRTYCLDRFIHLNDLLKDVVLLLLFDDGHDGAAVLNEVLLPLHLERAHLLQVVELQLHQLHLLLDVY